MKQLLINDTLYGPEEVLAHRLILIQSRDEALRHNDFESSIFLSITVALLSHLAEELNNHKGDAG